MKSTMIKVPKFFGLHAEPPQTISWIVALLPFVLLIALYLVASHIRLEKNPQDKLLPSIPKMTEAIERMAFTQDKRTGEYLMVKDTLSSLKRIGTGITLAAISGLLVGLNMGLFPGMRSILLAFITFISIIPPLAILPILLIVFGVDELAKIMLIFIGTFPMITRDIYIAVQKTPMEQITKALTLGASQLKVVYRVILPQIMPRLFDTVRLSLGSAWLFLIAAEAIASTDGLGYRIFLVRRYLDMAVIIPYVVWITFIGAVMDWLLRKLITMKYSWYLVSKY